LTGPRYNERAWAIDVISEINRLVGANRFAIQRAGGESGVAGLDTTLFPDVLLYEDRAGRTVIQGWELKFPDTPITDGELIERASTKARMLGLGTFLVWNVSEAVVYAHDGESDEYRPVQSWDTLADIRSRAEVQPNEGRWKTFLVELLRSVSELIDDGTVRPRSAIEAFRADGAAGLILQNVPRLAAELEARAAADGAFDAWATMWWASSRAEYRGDVGPWQPLARQLTTAWISRLVFTHMLRRYDRAARSVNRLSVATTQAAARVTLSEITRSSDFLSIIGVPPDEPTVDPATWIQLMELSEFLATVEVEALAPEAMQRLLEQVLAMSRRKAAGQFATPQPVAQLLVFLTMLDRQGEFADPFCGTGSIAREALVAKRDAGMSWGDSLATTWASDKYRFPIQLAAMALARPEALGEPLRVFVQDATALEVGTEVRLADPRTGDPLILELPALATIASNLPFVQFEDIDQANPAIRDSFAHGVGRELGLELPRRSDLYGYLPAYMWRLLRQDGRVGVITSNAWLASEAGDAMRTAMERLYRVESVVISGEGRWFEESDVVAVIVTGARRETPVFAADDEVVRFATVKTPIHGMASEGVRELGAAILTGTDTLDSSTHAYTQSELRGFRQLGLRWSAAFADLTWVNDLRDILVSGSSLFSIARGERRGWDPMFYPPEGHGIEPEYLRPVLMNSRHIQLTATPDKEAFCCEVSEEELERRGHEGAARWIDRFRHARNGVGRPLPEALAGGHRYWYGMDDSTVADLVLTMNPGARLFVSRLTERAFVNQRLIRLTALPNVDVELVHALANCTVSLFWIEALGFGRGLGALDLSATRVRAGLQVIAPAAVAHNRDEILERFRVLLRRNVLPLDEEVNAADRGAFDTAVLRAVGRADVLPRVRNALTSLYGIRTAVNR
jgi:hypothetical protein